MTMISPAWRSGSGGHAFVLARFTRKDSVKRLRQLLQQAGIACERRLIYEVVLPEHTPWEQCQKAMDIRRAMSDGRSRPDRLLSRAINEKDKEL